jgi:hypothetical protein
MTKPFVRVLAATALALGAHSSTAFAQTRGIEVPPVPAAIEPPAGQEAFVKGHAIGTQNYVCVQTNSGYQWRFIGPQATLFLKPGSEILDQIATHFLSVNPEDGFARATWQDSVDTSRVWARALTSSNDPAYVENGAIPWLLLETVGTGLGPTGGSFLAQTTYIQRLNTSGGLAPTTGCAKRADIGGMMLVPYTADYFLYRAEGNE